MATIPRQNDVLFGKGAAINTHIGNKHFRSKVELQKTKFVTAKRAEKREVAKNIVNEIQMSGGRFLMEDHNTNTSRKETKGGIGSNMKPGSGVNHPVHPFILDKVWVFVEKDKVMDKVMHRLREKRASPGQQQPTEPKKLELHPSNTKPAENNSVASKVETVDGMTAGIDNEEEAKEASNVLEHYEADRVTSQIKSTVDNSFDRAPIPVSIQTTLQPIANNISSVASFARAPVPVTIQYWIKSSVGMTLSSDDYLKGAVNLALLLTKELIRLIAAAEITLLDIAIEKVIIFVDPPSALQPSNRLAVQAVQFQQGALPLMSMSQRAQHASLPLSPRAVCAALGNILVEIFSKGRSSPPGTSRSTADISYCTQSNHAFMLPAQQRTASVPMGGSISAMVNSLLLEVGMPLSIRQLLCDLLDAVNQPCPDSALTSLEEVMSDLTRMKDDPQCFLLDRTCPFKALDDTCLFHGMDRPLFGREKELGILMNAKKNIANHVQEVNGEDPTNLGNKEHSNVSFGQEIDFYCETVFLSGYAGSGKSRLLQSLIHTCAADGWFVLNYKFDKQTAPIKTLAKAFDDLFGKWDDLFGKWASNDNEARSDLDPAMMESFHYVCRSIFCTIDKEGLSQLCEIIPNLGKIFPQIATTEKGRNLDQGTSSIDIVGSATKRRMNLFHVLFKSLCSAGRPVLFAQDDIHWNDSIEGFKDFIVNYLNLPCAVQKEAKSFHHGLMIVGTFRSNEVGESIIETMNFIEQSESAKFTKLDIGELAQSDIGKFLSATLCLPLRYTQKMAGLVHSKTRGNPFFVIQFLKTIIQNRMLQFSVNSRRWTWDCDIIDMQMISDGVAELLTTRFNQLPLHLMQTVIIASCFGSQVDDSTIDLLNIGQQLLPFNMQDALQLAIKEGILEKAGPIYQFTHDLIQQTIYESIPTSERKILHKTAGTILLRSAANNSTIHLLAVDQINFHWKDVILSPEERPQVASINATAAKFAIAASSFEQARSYIDAGMRLLGTNHWEEQYSLSLQLYEMSASISCINGDIGAMSSCLHQLIANVKSFEDSLTSSSLLAKLLAASSKYDEAISNCLSILSALGEEFPQDISLPIVLNELSVIQTTLANISVDQVKLLPPMTDKSKLNAMKFLSMLCSYSIQSKPILLPILSCRMVRTTIEHGFCDDSIVGLVTAGFSLFSFTDDIELGYRVGKVGESLIEESPNRHALRSRLCIELDSTLKALVEPAQSVVAILPDRYNSAMLAGDMGSAMLSLLSHCIGSLHIGSELISLSKSFVSCIKQSTKYQQNIVLYLAMSAFGACIYLSGRSNDEVDVKSYAELNQIGERKKLLALLYQNFFNEMSCYFWMGDYIKVVELSKKHKPSGQKRILEVMRTFFEGIASLTLARHTHQPNWRKTGEEALEKVMKWEKISKWNFETMAKLLHAELHYLNGDLESADVVYKASIVSAREHKFTHYEALACELYGIFCVENRMVDEGAKQLQMALDKYRQWGAMRKVEDLQLQMDTVDPSSLPSLRKFKMKI